MIIKSFPSGPLSVNCYFVGDDITKKAFIVDPGGFNSRLDNYIKENAFSLDYIILTHGHSDHIGGVKTYQEAYNAKIIAHKDDASMLAHAADNFSLQVYGKAIAFEADIYIPEITHLSVGTMELEFIHTPGHTPGGMCMLVENHLFTGDTLFFESIGRTDFPGSSFDALAMSVHNKLFILPDETLVYPGHMGETTIGH
jgi:glyoxylase-like metal-dependent hydrolase (beta-lactamase superfamily II)